MKKPSERSVSENLNMIVDFLETTRHLEFAITGNFAQVVQSEDRKSISISLSDIEKVLLRHDVDGSQFIQVNFSNKTKILITRNLVGFKPTELLGFDSAKIPRVVTTVDLQSVTKALEETYDSDETYQTATEIEVLKKVYQSIMLGAEAVGFDMKNEKLWFSRFLLNTTAATA